MSPSVSIVLSSFNHVSFVAEAMESVLAQDYDSFELIVRDDGSTDGTPKVLEQYRDPRIVRLDSAQNLGGAASLNYCIKHARGEFIAVMNSDDVWLPERLSTQVAIMKSQPDVGAVFSHAEIIDARGAPVQAGDHFYATIFQQGNRTQHEWLRHFFQKGNCLCHPSALIRRMVYEDIGLYDPLMDQLPDFDLWVRLCARYPIHVHQAPLLRFRVLDHEANASGDSFANRDKIAYELTKVLGHFEQPWMLEQLQEIFPEWVKPGDGRAERLRGLANAALAVASSPHHFFALDCLRKEVAAANGEGGLTDKQDLPRKLARSARPFSLVYERPVKCRIKMRSGVEAFSGQRAMTLMLDTGVVTSGVVVIPSGTEQVRLEIEGGYTSLEVMGLSLEDAQGTLLWELASSAASVKVSGTHTMAGAEEKLRYASKDSEVTKITLPVVAMAAGGSLNYVLRIDHDHGELLRCNEQLRQRINELEAKTKVPQSKAEKPSWFARLWPQASSL